jgi:HSP90 family molecular chaperone
LLDIVSHSLYSERDVFLRELVSNASDALQKHAPDFQGPREIKVEANKVNKTLTIVDSGVGMSRQEMLTNLGTIGKSGSGALGKQNTGIIGQFGVGFYSVFMVAKSVAVTSRRAGEAEAFTWRSEGKDSFTIRPAAAADAPPDFVGTKVELELREDAHEFCEDARVREVIKRYSNFVAFPVYVDGERANASEALWTEDPSQVGEERYAAFYKSTFGAFDVPAMTVHFRTDVPLDIKALLYIGKDHDERVGMGRVRPGVALHARKVLVESASEALLPGWARFVKGVVDSEDLPLSISRESATSNALVTKIGKVVCGCVCRRCAGAPVFGSLGRSGAHAAWHR